MISVEARYDDGVVTEAVVEKFVKYFKSILHHNSWYFSYFVSCRSPGQPDSPTVYIISSR